MIFFRQSKPPIPAAVSQLGFSKYFYIAEGGFGRRAGPDTRKGERTMELPLKGIRILDLSTMYPGPLCTMMLADFGAEVIRVEPPKGGDLWRLSQPRVNGLGMPYLQVNRNKKSLCLNLKEPEAREIFYKLVRGADVVVEQYRPAWRRGSASTTKR